MNISALCLMPAPFYRRWNKRLISFAISVFLTGCSGTEFPNPAPPEVTNITGISDSENSTTDVPLSEDGVAADAGNGADKRGLLRGIPLFAYLFNQCFEPFRLENGDSSEETLFAGVDYKNDRVRISGTKDRDKGVDISYAGNRVTVSYDDNGTLKTVVTGSTNILPSIEVQCISDRRVESYRDDSTGKEYVFYSTPDKSSTFEFTVTLYIDENKKGTGRIREFIVSVKDTTYVDTPAKVYHFKIIDSSGLTDNPKLQGFQHTAAEPGV